ncbi:MAG: mechanosensitive ion channel family protein [Bdellovibrionales bacterium]|nr:mechanosensitive ion channel family protein [Bdellovibrionales bacterium]
MKPFLGMLLLSAAVISNLSFARSPLEPLKTDHPRDTMRSYMEAMNDYRKGVKTGDEKLLARLNDAVRTLNLDNESPITRQERGREVAILLKETIDRVIVINYDYIPEDPATERWRLKDTEIVISKIIEGERSGEFLFSPATVARTKEFYNKVKDLPYVKGSGQGALYKAPWQDDIVPEWARQDVLGYKLWQLLALLASTFIGLFVKILSQGIWNSFEGLVSKDKESIPFKAHHAVSRPIGLIAASGFWFFTVHLLQFEGLTETVLLTVVKVTFGVSVVWGLYRLVDVVEIGLMRWAESTENELDDHLMPLIAKTVRVLTVVFGVLLVIQNLGFNVMSLLAGLGLGGLAFALAAKDTAANFFGSIMILIDQPFRIGDWIKTNSVEGTVEDIGFRSTRVRTFYNSLISVPNSALVTTNIDNLGLREYRRTVTSLGITYDTPTEKIEAFLEGIKNILFAHPNVRKDYFHVVFEGFGDSSLNIMVYFFLVVDDWSEELVVKQNVYLQIIDLAAELGVEFAYPTQTLHVETFPEKKPYVERHQDNEPAKLKDMAKKFSNRGERSQPGGKGIFTPPYKSPESQPFEGSDSDNASDAGDGDGL